MELLVNTAYIFAKNQRIETERLMLRPVELRDASDMFAYAKDLETTRFLTFPPHQTKEDTEYSIANYFMASPLGKYGIESKETGRLIGTVDLRVMEEQRTGEIGYVLNRNYWGRGYVPEAVESLLQLGFEQLRLVRIFATHDSRNPNSGRVMEKAGMKLEGILPDAQKLKGEVITVHLRGITKKEWEKSEERENETDNR